MKNLILGLCLLLSLSSAAQKIDGFYTGVLHNDSARMIQKYELAIAMYKGKISGYSYVTFIANDTFYFGIRKVKGEIIGDSMIIEDDKHISNNFPEKPAKGIKRTLTIPLNGQDSLTIIIGNWKTNQRKFYYSVPGSIEMTKSSDSSQSPLIMHLKELGIIEENHSVAYSVPAVKKETRKTESSSTSKEKEKIVAVSAPVIPAKIPFDQRTNREIQTVDISSDSLILSFYDNGVVDGDSISVYVNGKRFVENVKLTTSATKKTLYTEGDEITITLVAENLGTIPPNTGLLTIRDGEVVHQVNFSADLKSNASIRIRKKK